MHFSGEQLSVGFRENVAEESSKLFHENECFFKIGSQLFLLKFVVMVTKIDQVAPLRFINCGRRHYIYVGTFRL